MAIKIDTLNISTSAKPLFVVSKSEMNSNIEVFDNSKTKANIDEIAISTASLDIEPKEKADNTKKGLIGTGIALGCVAVGVASYLLFKKSLKILLNPNYQRLILK